MGGDVLRCTVKSFNFLKVQRVPLLLEGLCRYGVNLFIALVYSARMGTTVLFDSNNVCSAIGKCYVEG
jgi:hypothetical protein